MIMTFVSTILAYIPRIGWSENDSREVRLEKAILVSTTILVILATGSYGLVFLIFREYAASLISISFSLFALACLVYIKQTCRYRKPLFLLNLLGILLPFSHTLILGGIWSSGAVIVWSLMVPLGALIFFKHKHAIWWWLAFLGLLSTSAVLQPFVEAPNNLPPALIRAFFVLNVGSVSSITLIVLSYFIRQKDEAYRLLRIEEEKAENLLLNILPKEIAAILKDKEQTIADHFDGASVLFADLVGFTPLSANMAPVEMVKLLNEIFSHFDNLVDKYGVEKIRTIGDNYMVAAGVPRSQSDHAHRLAAMALEMQDYIQKHWNNGRYPIKFRVGINSGPVIGGVIGRKKFVYDVWGDAVNIASRMESQGVPGQIQLTRETYELICNDFICQPRGSVQVKGRGEIETWFLVGRKTGS
jgi:adenylate cyclase